MSQRIPVGLLGATGTVGERIVRLLHDHPWLELAEVAASDASAGATLAERIPPSDGGELPGAVGEMVLREIEGPWEARLILSALPSDVAREVEPRLAREGHVVVSNASAHRMEADVPLLVPEVNPEHLELVDRQAERWPGALVTNPNCVVAGLVVALAPLDDAFGVERVVVTTLQSISGAGRPGPAAGEMTDNVIPFIPGEEEKIGAELSRILGRLDANTLSDAALRVSATATRVPVRHGHLASVSLGLREAATPDAVADALRSFRGRIAGEGLPTAPTRPVEVLEGQDRPQPLADRDRGGGMTVTVGRIRPCPVLDVKLAVLSHNLVRGAAGAALLNAELCCRRGVRGLAAPERAGGASAATGGTARRSGGAG